MYIRLSIRIYIHIFIHTYAEIIGAESVCEASTVLPIYIIYDYMFIFRLKVLLFLGLGMHLGYFPKEVRRCRIAFFLCAIVQIKSECFTT